VGNVWVICRYHVGNVEIFIHNEALAQCQAREIGIGKNIGKRERKDIIYYNENN